jgi:hypothetical protein
LSIQRRIWEESTTTKISTRLHKDLPEDKTAIEKIAAKREWLGRPIYLAFKKILENE